MSSRHITEPYIVVNNLVVLAVWILSLHKTVEYNLKKKLYCYFLQAEYTIYWNLLTVSTYFIGWITTYWAPIVISFVIGRNNRYPLTSCLLQLLQAYKLDIPRVAFLVKVTKDNSSEWWAKNDVSSVDLNLRRRNVSELRYNVIFFPLKHLHKSVYSYVFCIDVVYLC